MNPHGEDIEGMTHCLTDYLNFSADVVSPVKTARCYPNNKPWVTREVKTVLNKKKAAFRSRDREAMKAAQQEVKHCVKEAKDSYRRKVEQKLRENNMREVWEGVRTITDTTTPPPSSPTSTQSPLITTDQVRGQLRKLRPRKAAGPDKVCPRLLKTCAAELGEPLQRIFNLSLQIGRVPTLWKTSRIVPVPKKNRPSELNDFRPVALTSHLMKTLERLFLSLLRPPGAARPGSPAVRLPTRCWCGGCHPLPAPSKPTPIWIREAAQPQYVGLKDITSDTVVSSTGAPQGTVLAPLLFTLYTSDFFYNSELCHIQKYADRHSHRWVHQGGQRGGVSETGLPKTAVLHFLRRHAGQLQHLQQTAANCFTSQMWFLPAVVASVLFYTVVCWGGSISKKDTSRLDKLIRRAGSVVGMKLDSLVTVAESRTLDKLLDIMDNASHPLHTVISNQRSLFSERLCKCRTNRLKNSLCPSCHHTLQLLTRGEEDIE
ncbi:hypothetical protein L3Q82_020842 [Scortum barcoo]|uniref:Uncharacterized protein n=1 Tax=Scortum barcoo TaxID=214431 RepID=A0ACB8V9V8_9TELE|nr:hypothetical protein L3Q82_020842 [Scortum barcoo]